MHCLMSHTLLVLMSMVVIPLTLVRVVLASRTTWRSFQYFWQLTAHLFFGYFRVLSERTFCNIYKQFKVSFRDVYHLSWYHKCLVLGDIAWFFSLHTCTWPIPIQIFSKINWSNTVTEFHRQTKRECIKWKLHTPTELWRLWWLRCSSLVPSLSFHPWY